MTGETTETLETKVYREQGCTTGGKQEETGETTETLETRIHRKQGQWETEGDSEALGRLQRPWRLGYIGRKDSGRLRVTVRDWGD